MDYNDAIQACRDMVKEWDRRDASRRKALSQLQTKSPLPHASRFGGHPIQGWLLFVFSQRAEGLPGEGEGGAVGEGGVDEPG